MPLFKGGVGKANEISIQKNRCQGWVECNYTG